MKYTKRLILSLALTITASIATGQTNGSNSPYSRYGYGLLSDRANGFNKGMGGVAYGMRSATELNSKNPATYAWLDSLTFLFDVGISLQNGNFDAGTQRVNAKNTSMDYLQAGFRAAKGLGMTVGMVPYSTIGYKVSSTGKETYDPITGYDVQTQTYRGDGGVHEVFYGIGWSPFKDFSIGGNAGYLWGSLNHLAYEEHSNSAINTRRTEYDAHLRTWKLDAGLQYTIASKKSGIWTLGATYGVGHDANSSARRYRQTLSSGALVSGDSISTRKAFQLPHTIGVGLGWNYYRRIRVGVDYTFEKWGDVKYPYSNGNRWESTAGKMLDKHSFAAGIEFMPKPNGIKWGDHVVYRAGVSYSTPYTKVEHNGKWVDGPTNLAVSLGLGLPIATKYDRSGHHSIFNLAAQYERVKPKYPGMVTENYFRISIGITFNERWFMKWKVD